MEAIEPRNLALTRQRHMLSRIFVVTGTLTLPAALVGLYFGGAFLLAGDAAPLGLVILAMVGAGLLIYAGHLHLVGGGEPEWESSLWAGTLLYHVLLGLGALLAALGGAWGALLALPPYGALIFAARRALARLPDDHLLSDGVVHDDVNSAAVTRRRRSR